MSDYDFSVMTDQDLLTMLAEIEGTQALAETEGNEDFCRAVRQELIRRWTKEDRKMKP